MNSFGSEEVFRMIREFKIRKAIVTDAEQIHALHLKSVRELCKTHYSSGQIDGWLNHRTPERYEPGITANEMYVAICDKLIVGFGHAVVGEIVAVYVMPEFQRQGVGALLLNYGISIAQSGNINPVRLDSTLNAQGFYEKAGFVEIERKTEKHGDSYLTVVKMELRSNPGVKNSF